MIKNKKIIEYKPNGKPQFIKCGTWTWETICPKHLPMTLQKQGFTIQKIRGFKRVENNEN